MEKSDGRVRQKHSHRKFILFMLIAVLLYAAVSCVIQHESEGVKFTRCLGIGWNMGNLLDAHGLGRDAGDPEFYAAYWGSCKPTLQTFETLRDAGFGSVRIPVTWYEHIDADGVIETEWLDHVQEMVDCAINSGLYVIINAHHDMWYEPAADNIETGAAMMECIWLQIAERFAAYDSRLLFECMNEPRLIGAAVEWTGTEEACGIVNYFADTFVRTVRGAGGFNAERYLLIPTYAASTDRMCVNELRLPNDDKLIVSAHLYLPYDFALNESGTAEWNVSNQKDTQQIKSAIKTLYKRFVKKGVPVVITEFGAFDKQNEEARAQWTEYVLKTAGNAKISCIWWDNSIFDTQTNRWKSERIKSVLTGTVN